MKLIVLLLTVTCLQLSARGYAQEVTLKKKNASLDKIFEDIYRQTGYQFVYTYDMLKNARKVNVDANHAPLSEVLENCFKDQPFTYQLIGKAIVVKRKPAEESANPESLLRELIPITVTGKVTDSLGNPLIGVTIKVKAGGTGAVTDAKGNYSLSVSDDAVLIVSYIGYQTQEIAVDGKTSLNIVLKQAVSSLDQLVVVGYGTEKKVNLTGAVASVDGKIFDNRPITNIGQGLQGELANLNVNISNGSPNTTPSLNIRGGTSFAYNTSKEKYEFLTGSPLILVDGVEMDINQLDPSDIANISVLKDAASAAIYGARAAYGVVLITTKNGKKSQTPKVKYTGSIQWNKPSAVPDELDAYTIQKAAMDAYTIIGQTPPSNMQTQLDAIKAHMDDPNAPVYYMSPGGSIIWVGNNDEYALALRNSTPMQKHNLSVTGGTDKTTYYASLGYMNQDGIYRLNTDKYNRYNGMLSLTTNITDWFSVNFKTIYSISDYSEPVSPDGKGGWWTAMSQEPYRNINMPIKTPASSPVGVMYTDNILSFMDYGSRNQETNENNTLSIAPVITPIKGWNIKGNFSYLASKYRQKQYIPELDRIETNWNNPTNVYTSPTSVQRWSNNSNQYTLDLYSDYTFSLGKNNFYALAGFNQEWYKETDLWGEGQDLISSVPVISLTQGNQYASDAEPQWARRGAFYRVTYNYNGKYLLESDGRYDGSSKFPHDDRFKFFQSFSGAWRISEEPFAQQLKPVVSNLKLRASYGSLGNQDVANNMYILSYGVTTQMPYLIGGVLPVGVTPPGLVSPNITWETAATKDFGLDFGLYNKLDVSFDWYNRTTTNILVQGTLLPSVLGATPPTQNSGSLRTLGWDLTAEYHDELQNGLKFDVRLVLSTYGTEITSFNGNPNKVLSTLYAGEEMGEIWGYTTVGTFQTQDQINKAPTQYLLNSGVWYPGDIQYKDINKNDTIGPGANTLANHGDMKIIGNSTPKYSFGFNVDASWKNFDLNFFIQGVGKRDYWIGSNLYWGAINGGTGTWYVYDHSWTPERTNAFFPAYRPKSANVLTQTKYLINAAYAQLKNVTLGYNLPDHLVKDKLHMDQIKVFVAGYDLFRVSKIPKIFDPQMMSADYPMFKSMAAGLQVQF